MALLNLIWSFLKHLSNSYYHNNSAQVGFINTLLSKITLSWFAPFKKKRYPLLNDMELFMEAFHAAYGDSDCERVAETKCKIYVMDHALHLFILIIAMTNLNK